ncbi:hypothetical protein [Yersinia ruckeri]|nr:hypothetical protein [Yersinia ruckeri]EKN4689048.1 hypothetical protein [Yersinia ruckeri]MCK8585285.1 hypothetical protein [Yersinia ruckeri]MCW6524258.1 hypothetical protein [Yersinia ruckeri]MCW6528378.1 hypothetical protein [Yersinia ruckeri]MCW6563326.1 hypothetical protein [Yersinia ruckeri]
MTDNFIKQLQYRHRLTSANIHHKPVPASLKFFFACVIGAFMFLAIAVKI